MCYRYTNMHALSHTVRCSRQPATPWESELSKLQQVQGQQGGKNKGATGSAAGTGESMPPGANQVRQLLIVTNYLRCNYVYCTHNTVCVQAAWS
jgi:hypothetical protein